MKFRKIIPIIFIIFFISANTILAQEYSRKLFPHWKDLNNNGKNTRIEVLIADKLGNQCLNEYYDIYTGDIINNPRNLDIDHIVPLKWAWDHGASSWTLKKRTLFANDLDNLYAVSAKTNRSKGDSGPEEWLPPRLTFVPTYIKRFMLVCDKYGLKYNHELYKKLIEKYQKFNKGIHLNFNN